MGRRSKSIVSALLCLLCVLGLVPTQASAAGTINTDEKGQLTIEYRLDGKAVSGVPFDLYYVAGVDANANYTLTGDFKDYPVKLNGLDSAQWKSLAETLTAYVKRDNLIPMDSGTTNADGNLYFPADESGLPTGLYLAIGRQYVKDGYTFNTEPFLVSIPTQDGDGWAYRVVAEAKFSRDKNPDGPSDSKVRKKVIKLWEDDTTEIRPKEIVVQLLKDGALYDTVRLNDANNWQYLWEELPEYSESGSKIVWEVAEKKVRDYTVLVEREGLTFVVTNTAVPEDETETLKKTVQKVWSDKGYEDKRPKSISVSLLKNGEPYDEQTLSEQNDWVYTWKELPRNDESGNAISWTIQEDSVSGYKGTVEQKGNTFVLTNTYSDGKLPQTGLLWWPVPLLAAGGLIFLTIGVLYRRKQS